MAVVPDPWFVLRGHQSPVTCVSFGGDALAAGDLGGECVVWSLQRKRSQLRWQPHPGKGVLSVAMLESGRMLSHGAASRPRPCRRRAEAGAGREGALAVWDVGAGAVDAPPSL